MAKSNSEQEFEKYLDGASDISHAYKRQAREQAPRRVDDAILAASRKAVNSRPKIAFSPFSSTWQVPVSLAAVLVLSIGLVFTLQEQTGEGRIQVPVPVISDEKISAPEKRQITIRQDQYQPAGNEPADLILSRKQIMDPSEKSVEAMQESRVTAMDADVSESKSLKKELQSMPAKPPVTSVDTIDVTMEDRVTALESEIVELQQDKLTLEEEKAELEQDLEQIREKQDALKRKLAGLDLAEASIEIQGTRAQVAWLSHIRNLMDSEQYTLAEENLIDFKQEHPDYSRQQLERILPWEFVRKVYSP